MWTWEYGHVMIVTISFRATEGNRDGLVEALTAILPDTLAFEGCNNVVLSESDESPGELLLFEDWESAENYEAYKAWRRESGSSVLGSGLVVEDSLSSQTFTRLN